MKENETFNCILAAAVQVCQIAEEYDKDLKILNLLSVQMTKSMLRFSTSLQTVNGWDGIFQYK